MSYQSIVETKPSLDTTEAAAFLGVSPQPCIIGARPRNPERPPISTFYERLIQLTVPGGKNAP